MTTQLYGTARGGQLHVYTPGDARSNCGGAQTANADILTPQGAARYLLHTSGMLCDRCFDRIPEDIRYHVKKVAVTTR